MLEDISCEIANGESVAIVEPVKAEPLKENSVHEPLLNLAGSITLVSISLVVIAMELVPDSDRNRVNPKHNHDDPVLCCSRSRTASVL